jgi:hypothetical protein
LCGYTCFIGGRKLLVVGLVLLLRNRILRYHDRGSFEVDKAAVERRCPRQVRRHPRLHQALFPTGIVASCGNEEAGPLFHDMHEMADTGSTEVARIIVETVNCSLIAFQLLKSLRAHCERLVCHPNSSSRARTSATDIAPSRGSCQKTKAP